MPSPTASPLTLSTRTLTFPLGSPLPSATLTLTNPGPNAAAFKVKTTNPSRYVVRPNLGALAAHASVDVVVALHRSSATTHAASGVALTPDADLVAGPARDKFLLQAAPAPDLDPDAPPAAFWAGDSLPAGTTSAKLRVQFVDGDGAAADPRGGEQVEAAARGGAAAAAAARPTDAPGKAADAAGAAVTAAGAVRKELEMERKRAVEALPDAEELLARGNGAAAKERAQGMQEEVNEKAKTVAKIKADLSETQAEKERVLGEAPKAPLSANHAVTDPFGGVSLAGIALLVLLFAIVVRTVFWKNPVLAGAGE